ncbi:6-phosphogluconate dehydrogenase [Cephaloticoccus primus]|uniref:6-phosphogluconate dehydrogenase n=1 Tax=Cephaloticoccus primus TaxID=1548207 RepID=A0A139SIT8_9BACT|nr:NAD(P)-dependent oxidoreductase [Cephaloticoccus primus]KXU34390.1 6-phosphogluconate dehydrogenase [Cephaloticoccus primus]
MSTKIGVIGLGIIGRVWAGHYAAAGVLGGTWNRTARADAPSPLGSPEAVACASDVVQVVVADPPAVQAVLERILPALGPGKVLVQSSTIDPQSSERFRVQVLATGARYLEAPFTGSKPAAEARQTVFYLGGEAGLIAELEPLLGLVSSLRLHIGDHRQACTLKLAMNLNIAAQMQGLCEALTLVRHAGVTDDVFFNALRPNITYSGLAKLKEPKLRAGDYAPQFSVKHMLKDIRLSGLALAGDAGRAGTGSGEAETSTGAASGAEPHVAEEARGAVVAQERAGESCGTGEEPFAVRAAVLDRLAAAARAGYGEEDICALLKLL